MNFKPFHLQIFSVLLADYLGHYRHKYHLLLAAHLCPVVMVLATMETRRQTYSYKHAMEAKNRLTKEKSQQD